MCFHPFEIYYCQADEVYDTMTLLLPRLPRSVAQTLTTLYSIIIIIGTLANFSLLAAFCTNKARDSSLYIYKKINCKLTSQVLLTTRNILIANLAISDLLMSTTSIPLTLVDILYKYWPLGDEMVRDFNVN